MLACVRPFTARYVDVSWVPVRSHCGSLPPPPNRIDAATPVDPLLAELANVTTALPIPEADVHATITDLGFGGRIVRVGSSLRSPEEFADHLGVSIDRVVKAGEF